MSKGIIPISFDSFFFENRLNIFELEKENFVKFYMNKIS